MNAAGLNPTALQQSTHFFNDESPTPFGQIIEYTGDVNITDINRQTSTILQRSVGTQYTSLGPEDFPDLSITEAKELMSKAWNGLTETGKLRDAAVNKLKSPDYLHKIYGHYGPYTTQLVGFQIAPNHFILRFPDK